MYWASKQLQLCGPVVSWGGLGSELVILDRKQPNAITTFVSSRLEERASKR